MRRALVLIAALIMMLSLHALRTESPGDSSDPMFLAAVGFVVLAAFTVGEIGKSIRLPAITGYIVAGLLLGPQVSKVVLGPNAFSILSDEVVERMSVFNTLALGLIAITAGLEFDLKAIRRVAWTLAATVATKIPLLLLFVGGGLFLIETYLSPLGVASSEHIMGLALVLGVLGIGTSPAIALAIVAESGAKGRLSDITMAIAVVKDLVVVVSLAVAIAVTRLLIDPAGAAVSDALLHVGRELGGSIVLGGAVGGVLILYLKYVKKELLLTSLLTVLVIAEVTALLHLELLLVFIVAGFVVRNFSHFEHDLLEPLERISLPIFVVFFTTAGAKVDVLATLAVLPVAAALAALRAVAYFLAGRAGAAIGGEETRVKNNAWLAYTPQAGVTIGLVLLAAKALPALADPIRQTGLAIVTINLLVGPVLMGIALKRAGETPDAGPTVVPAGDEDSADQPEVAVSPALAGLADPELVELVDTAGRGLAWWRTAFVDDVVRPLLDRTRRTTVGLFVDHHRYDDPSEAIRRALAAEAPDPTEGLEAAIEVHLRAVRDVAKGLPLVAVVSLTAEDLASAPDDGLAQRSAKLFRRAGAWIRRTPGLREVPVRRLFRYAFEEELATTATALFSTWFRIQQELVGEVGRIVAGTRAPDDAKTVIDGHLEELETTFGADLDRALGRGQAVLTRELAELGTPGHPARDIRLHRTLEAAERALAKMRATATGARTRAYAELDTLHARALIADVQRALREAHERLVLAPLSILEEELLSHVEDLARDLSSDRPIDELLDNRTRARIRGLQIKYRHATQGSLLLASVAKCVERLPERLTIIDHDETKTTTFEISFAREVEEELVERYAVSVGELLDAPTDLVAAIDARLDQVVSIARFAGQEEADEREEDEGRTRAAAMAEQLATSIRTAVEASREAGSTRLDEALERVEDRTLHSQSASERVKGSTRGTGRLLLRRFEPLWDRLRGSARKALRRIARFRSRPEVQDWLAGDDDRHFDPVRIRRYLAKATRPANGVTAVYQRLFSPHALEDSRLAVARKRQLEELVRAVQPGKREDFANVLIVGDSGSGRTTLVNLLALRLARHRVIRLDHRYHTRETGIVEALAVELGVAPTRVAVQGALRRSTTIVLIDDLERFVLPNASGVDALGSFLSLVIGTSAFTHWIVSVQRGNVVLFDELTPLTEAFGRWLTLAPLGARELEALVEARSRVSGLTLLYRSESRWLDRLRVGDPRRVHFRALARLSGGNIRAALLLHLLSVEKVADDVLAVRPPRALRLPFIDRLGPERLASLATFLRYGALTDGELAKGIQATRTDVKVHVLPLRTAGLIVEAERAHEVPAVLDSFLREALVRQGILESAS